MSDLSEQLVRGYNIDNITPLSVCDAWVVVGWFSEIGHAEASPSPHRPPFPSSDDVRDVVEVASADHRGEVVHRGRSVRLVVDGRANDCYEQVAQIGMSCRAGRVGERGRLNEKLAAHIHW